MTTPRQIAPHGNALHMIHRWSIEHPYVVLSFYIAVIVLAWMGLSGGMARRFAPYVESPLVGVVTMSPGLSAREMETNVSKPIEEQMVNVKGVRYIRSNSQDGLSLVTLEFNYGVDIKKAIFDVQALMNVVQSNLPVATANMKPSWVIPIDPLNLPVLSLSISGDPAKGWDLARVREFADNTMVDRIKSVPDVYSIVPFGGFRRQLQVVVNRDKLSAYKLSILDVRNAVDRFSVNRPAGTLTDGNHESIVRLDSRAQSASDVLGFPIASFDPGKTTGPGPSSRRTVYVRNVANVVDGYWERRSAYHYLKHDPGTAAQTIPSVEVSIIQDPGASSAKVVPAVMAVVKQLEVENPGLKIEVAYDNKRFVDILFKNVWEELAIAILLTAVAIFLFLGEWRGTLIAMVTLPTSLAMAVLMMIPFGMTFNSGTLIGLLLSIGRLVDDSIIDIHAVERHLRMGKDPKTATVDGIAEVRLAVLASTLLLVLALTPLLFSGGITQLMFKELVWPLIFGLLASMIVSFTLTALLCANLLRREDVRQQDRQIPILKWVYLVVDPFQHFLNGMEHSYGRAIHWMLQNRFLNLTRVLATVIIGFTFYFFIGSEMMPLADVGQASGILEMAPGTSFSGTEAAVKKLEAIMLKYPEIEKASIELGAESMFESFSPGLTGYQMPQVSGAAMMITFSDKDRRKRTIWDVMDGVQKEAIASIPGIRRLQIKEMGSDVMATAAAPIHVNIYGPDLNTLNRLGAETLKVAEKMDDLYQPSRTWTMGLPEYRIRVNPQRAQEMGLSPVTIADQAYYALHGGLTNEFYRLPNIRQATIQVRYEGDERKTEQDLESLYVSAPDGRQVPLKSVAEITKEAAPTVIEHDGFRRVMGVTGYYRPNHLPSMDVVMELVSKTYKSVNFPPGYGLEMRGDMTQMMDSFRRLLAGLAIALIFMYLVLVMQFRGFLQPLQMIASLPLELSGVFVALWLAHQSFSTVSILGIIVLSGMDITTAVLLIDMIMRRRDEGVPRNQAVEEACPQRLRPILMTAGISLIVMLPIAIAPRTGMDAYQPLGTTIVGGLLVGTVLSLFDIPIMHTVMDDFIKWIHENKTENLHNNRTEKDK